MNLLSYAKNIEHLNFYHLDKKIGWAFVWKIKYKKISKFVNFLRN